MSYLQHILLPKCSIFHSSSALSEPNVRYLHLFGFKWEQLWADERVVPRGFLADVGFSAQAYAILSRVVLQATKWNLGCLSSSFAVARGNWKCRIFVHGLNREAVASQQSKVNNFSTLITLEMDFRGLKHSPWTPEDLTYLTFNSLYFSIALFHLFTYTLKRSFLSRKALSFAWMGLETRL